MSAVRCPVHGHEIGGPMACGHLNADVWGGATTRPFQEFPGDFFDDGTLVLTVALCTEMRRQAWRFLSRRSQFARY